MVHVHNLTEKLPGYRYLCVSIIYLNTPLHLKAHMNQLILSKQYICSRNANNKAAPWTVTDFTLFTGSYFKMKLVFVRPIYVSSVLNILNI